MMQTRKPVYAASDTLYQTKVLKNAVIYYKKSEIGNNKNIFGKRKTNRCVYSSRILALLINIIMPKV